MVEQECLTISYKSCANEKTALVAADNQYKLCLMYKLILYYNVYSNFPSMLCQSCSFQIIRQILQMVCK